MKPRVLVFGYGNPARGDDALGPLLLERLQARRFQSPLDSIELECLTDFQLQIEHALDMLNREMVVFVDAHTRCPPPCTLQRVEPRADFSHTTHALSPAALLQVFEDIHPGLALPPCFLLSIRGYRFELGESLSPTAEDHLAAAEHHLENAVLSFFNPSSAVSSHPP